MELTLCSTEVAVCCQCSGAEEVWPPPRPPAGTRARSCPAVSVSVFDGDGFSLQHLPGCVSPCCVCALLPPGQQRGWAVIPALAGPWSPRRAAVGGFRPGYGSESLLHGELVPGSPCAEPSVCLQWEEGPGLQRSPRAAGSGATSDESIIYSKASQVHWGRLF